MNRMVPKISVVMSVYNGSRYLRESIESILNQTFTNFEFIIIDDCSSDNSWEILTKYSEQDERIVLIKNTENLGLTKSLNKGLKIAKGEYIARQDADDVSLPERLKKQLLFLDEHPDVALVSCKLEYIDSKGHLIGKEKITYNSDLISWYLLFYNCLAGHSQVVFRRELVLNLGGYCDSYRYSQDYELWCRIIKIGKIYILPEILLQQRRHIQSISSAKSLEQDSYALAQVKHNISQLIGKEITLEEAKYLKDFWMFKWRSQSYSLVIQEVSITNILIKSIYQAFIEQKQLENHYSKKMSSDLLILIGKQFIWWARFLKLQYGWKSKLIVYLYALKWHPLGILKYSLMAVTKKFIKLVMQLSAKNLKRIYNEEF